MIDKLQNLDEMSWRAHHANPDELSVYHEIGLSPREQNGMFELPLICWKKIFKIVSF